MLTIVYMPFYVCFQCYCEVFSNLRYFVLFAGHFQARSQKYAMGGCFGGFGGKVPRRFRHRGLGSEPQRSKIFVFFAKHNLNLDLFLCKLMLLKRGINFSSAKT